MQPEFYNLYLARMQISSGEQFLATFANNLNIIAITRKFETLYVYLHFCWEVK